LWTQAAELTASDAAEEDHLGVAVALSGDKALIGANGDENNTGSAYVFSLGLFDSDGDGPADGELMGNFHIKYGQFSQKELKNADDLYYISSPRHGCNPGGGGSLFRRGSGQLRNRPQENWGTNHLRSTPS
jgi:hypothetical protein